MARFELNGAPNKETPGAVGDICTDTLTNKKYKLSSMTKRYAYGKSHIEYHWVDFNDVESLSDRIEVLEQGGISEEAAERIIAEKMNEMGSLTADQINALIDDKANMSDIQTINDEIDEINEKLENFDGNIDLTDYAKVEDVYTKDEIDAKGYLTEIPDNYATTDDLNLKANVDEVYSIDEIDAKGFLTEIPDEYVTNDELDLKANAADVYTKAEIDAMGALSEIPEEYITEEELEAKGYATQDDLLLKADAANVYTKEEIDNMGALTEIPDEYITEEELEAKGYATQDDLLLKADADKVYTKDEIDAMGALTEIPDEYITETELADMGLATETFVTTKIAEAALAGSDVDLSGYATKDDLLLKADADKVYTKEEIDDMGYLTEIPDTYATKDDLLLKADADKVYTKDEIDAMGALTEIPDEYITEEELEAKGYATQDDLLLKADADKVYTKEEIDNMGGLTEIPEEYITEDELTAKGYLVADDIEDINTKLTQLETNQIKKTLINRMGSGACIVKIKPGGTSAFSKILITDVYGGCILITGALNSDSSIHPFKVVRLSNGSWVSPSPSTNTPNKIKNVHRDTSYVYITIDSYVSVYVEGGFIDIETIDSLPTGVTELPILDLTQESETDLTAINTKIAQLETQSELDRIEFDSRLDQLENTTNLLSGDNTYTDTEQEIGTWMGKKLYRRSYHSAGTGGTMSDVTLGFYNIDITKYILVKMEGTFRMGPDSSNVSTYQIPFYDFDTNASMTLSQASSGMINQIRKNLTAYKNYGIDVTFYYADK